MSGFFDGPLPKGMHMPEPEVTPVPEPVRGAPPEDYAHRIKQALASIEGLSVWITSMHTFEENGQLPRVELVLEILPKEE